MDSPLPEPVRPVYFIGCDMGGWHNEKTDEGDALAICKWAGGDLEHVEATADLTYFPVAEGSLLNRLVEDAIRENARIVVCIDAAFAWPEAFRRLVADAPEAKHDFSFSLTDAINNPYLYRVTDRFIKNHVLKRNPLTAVGDKFGNNSSKAQALVRWFVDQLPGAYRPPFHAWDRQRAATSVYTIVEVYPAASMKSKAFKKLKWPPHVQDMDQIGSSDIADAKRCAITGVCYARSVGLMPPDKVYPRVCCPDDPAAKSYSQTVISTEGWIFAPCDQ